MPTTKEEAVKITKIFDEYLTKLDAQEITERLHNEIGTDSDNTSLKVSLEMLRALYNKEEKRRFIKKIIILRSLLFIVVAAHFVVLFFNFLSIFVLPFYTPWYIALPVITLIINFAFTNTPCPLTRLEDKIRHELGIPGIKLFMGHYIVWPVRKWMNENRE